MHGNKTGFILGNINIKLGFEHQHRFFCDGKLLRIKTPRFPQHQIADIDAFAQAVNRHMNMVGQGNINRFIELYTQFFFCHFDNRGAGIEIINAQSGQQFLELFQHIMVAQAIDFIHLAIFHAVTVLLAKGQTSAHGYHFAAVFIFRYDYVVIQYLFYLHDFSP